MLNELRRTALEKVEQFARDNITRNLKKSPTQLMPSTKVHAKKIVNPNISVFLNTLEKSYNYDNLDKSIKSIYIPLKYFTSNTYKSVIQDLTKNFDVYIYMPTVVKVNYRNLFVSNIQKTLQKFTIKGFVLSNIGNLQLLETTHIDLSQFELIANHTLNIFNTQTVVKLKNLGINKFTNSCEANRQILSHLCDSPILKKELIVYGKLPLMNIRYCLLGKTNSCYPECTSKCTSNHIYELKDRLQMKFRLLPDNIQTVTTIYNSKILSILYDEFPVDSVRIDILDETIEEINKVVNTVKNHKRFEGNAYTNGNLNREI